MAAKQDLMLKFVPHLMQSFQTYASQHQVSAWLHTLNAQQEARLKQGVHPTRELLVLGGQQHKQQCWHWL